VLDLTEEVHDEAPPAPEPIMVSAPPADDVEFQPIETPVNSPAPAEAAEGLFSEKTRRALDDAFTSVKEREVETPSMLPAPAAPFNGRTLEAVFDQAVRGAFGPVLRNWLDENKDALIERMKPVITSWLDEHFPSMLEQAVKEELARVAKSRTHR
jgi:uncharacterized protein